MKKKILGILLTAGMAMSLLAGCGGEKDTGANGDAGKGQEQQEEGQESQESQEDEGQEQGQAGAAGEDPTATPHKIAVAIPDYGNAQMNMFKDIYENQIADAFNVEFIFSQALNNDVAAEMQFLENAQNSGAEAYISYNISTEEHSDNLVAKANDLQMYVAINSARAPKNVEALPYLAGAVGATEQSTKQYGEQFRELTDILISDGKKHNTVICTMGAATGSQQHITSTAAAMNALKDAYDLTFEDEPENLATAQSVTEIATGVEDVKIKLIPGAKPAVAADVEQALKAGEYDVLICVGPQYSWYENVIKSVEDNLKIDIKTCSIMGIGEATATSFHTADATGNPSLNCALLKNSSVADQLFVLAYNAITGNPDCMKVDGKAQFFSNSMWSCKDADMYDLLSQVDSTPEKACYSADEIKEVLSAYNPDVTAEDFEEWCNRSSAELIIDKLGLK